MFLIYDRYIWKGRIIFPSFLFSTTVNFLEDAHLQGWLWVFVKGYHLKVGYIEESFEAVHCTITFCILRYFVVVLFSELAQLILDADWSEPQFILKK